MANWFRPLLFGLVLALIGYQVATWQYPRVLMSLATGRVAGASAWGSISAAVTGGSPGGPAVNRLSFAELATDKSTRIVRPSPDLAYSSCPFDVSQGPVIVEAAPVPAPYWSLSVFDAWTDVVFVRNNIQAGGQPIKLAIAKKGQPVPDGMAVVRVSGDSGIALIRILVPDRAQFDAIDTARRKASCKPIS